jgi:hypothetical protein
MLNPYNTPPYISGINARSFTATPIKYPAALTELPDRRVSPAGLKNIVLASSAAALPENALPRPRKLCSVIAKPDAKAEDAVPVIPKDTKSGNNAALKRFLTAIPSFLGTATIEL